MDKSNDDAEFWNGADRNWEAVKAMVPLAAGLCLGAVLITLLSCACKTLRGSPRLSLAALVLNFLAFIFALASWALAVESSQLTAGDYDGVTLCQTVEVTYGAGLVLTILASILLFVAVVTSVVWKLKA